MTRALRVGLLAWLGGALATYVTATAFSQTVVMGQLYAAGVDVPINRSILSVLDAVVRMWGLLPVIMIAQGIGYGVARLMRSFLPISCVAGYMLAGAAAQFVPLQIMKALIGLYPILGAQVPVGLALQILAGALGGFVFFLSLSRGWADG